MRTSNAKQNSRSSQSAQSAQSVDKPGKGKLQHLSFYLVMLLCMAMVSIACWFAWAQTRNQMIVELDSAVHSVGDVKVMEMETAIPRSTDSGLNSESDSDSESGSESEPESENNSGIRSGNRPRTDSDSESVSDAESGIPAGVQPLETVPPETQPQPFTQSAAIIDAPQTAPVIITPDSPESEKSEESEEAENQTESVFVPSAPACYPLDGEIMETFSNGELVKSATTGVWQSHNGIDIAGTLGDAVCAMNSGIVESIENNPLWGVTITIDHRNGIYSRYCNLNTGVTVNAGDKVEAGTIIGAIGDTADIESAMDSHLHFEVLRGEIYLDPVAYIQSTETTADNAD